MHFTVYFAVFQVSLKSSSGLEEHLAVGEALANLRRQGVLIIGSGQTTHSTKQSKDSAKDFRNFIHNTLTNSQYSAEYRKRKMLQSYEQPCYKASHPTPDHYLPLPVCSAAADYGQAQLLYEEWIFQEKLLVSHYIFK